MGSLLVSLLSGTGGSGGGGGSVPGVILSPVVAATTGALTVTYANGSAGVGATLTNAGTQAAISLDGVSPTVGQRVLIKNQASAFQNGIYTVTVVGTGATNWVLTRATDFDQASEMTAGILVEITSGTVNAGTIQELTTTVTTVGTDSVTFISINITTKVDQNGSPIYGLDAVGTDAYAITLTPAPSSYTTGMVINFTAGTANTGNATLNVSSLGAKNILKLHDQTLATGDIEAGQIVTVIYDGTQFQMQSQIAQGGSTAGSLLSFQFFTASGTWTKPANVNSALIEVVGGGGGGSGASGTSTAGGGGGGGGYARKWSTSPGASQTVTIGAAGTAGTSGPGAGGTGGTSSFGAIATATGGVGGTVGSGIILGTGGAGGVGGSGDFNSVGGPGGNATYFPTATGASGQGGNSHYGGGGAAVASGAGLAGGNYGGGGSGAYQAANTVGGAGAPGIVIVWEYS